MTDLETRDLRPLATELKFLVSPDRAAAIRAWARAELKADPFGTGPHGDDYTTTTLYTDTAAWDVYRRRGSYGRSKYRVRWYGGTDIGFLERKMRTSTSLSKRRAPVPLGDVARLHAPISSLHGWTGEWFAHRLAARRLEPVCQVAYDRMARVLPSPHGLARLTVDSGLRARPAHRFAFEQPDYASVLHTAEILELKFVIALPSAFKALLTTFSLEPMKVSKYRLSAETLGLVPDAARSQEVA
ncbi:MAG: hypothetical protein AMXMBFR57_17930 [Acidimicrobiia bacterium]